MEPAGLAIGVAGLAGLFNTCIDVVTKVKTYKKFDRDSAAQNSRFRAELVRFQQWGQAVGLDSAGNIVAASRDEFQQPEVFSTVHDLLLVIKDICTDVDAQKHSRTCPKSDSGKNFFSTSPKPLIVDGSGKSRWHKWVWALWGKADAAEQVELLQNMVQVLHNLVPPVRSEAVGIVAVAEERHLGPAPSTAQAEAKREAVAWLMGNYKSNDRYDLSVQKKLPSTCDWILSRPAYIQWLSPSFPDGKAKLLWMHGPAGFGKTILCASIVQHLKATLEAPVAYFFFSSDLERQGNLTVVFRSWVSQLARHDQLKAALDIIHEARNKHNDPAASRSEVIMLLQTILQTFSGCTLLLDGLDECISMQGWTNDTESPSDFIETVITSAANTNTRVFLMSRDESSIRQALANGDGIETTEYKISAEDVKSDVGQLSRSIIDQRLLNKSTELRDELSQKMTDRCKGQFLWLKMQEQSLKKSMNKRQLLDSVEKTPSGLDLVYERNWERILNLDSCERNRGISLLMWAAFGLHPLRVSDITEAVLLESPFQDCLDAEFRGEVEAEKEACLEFPVDDLPDSYDEDHVNDSILGLCGSLLEVDDSNQAIVALRRVRLAHFSVKQFIMRKLPAHPNLFGSHVKPGTSTEKTMSTKLAKICLRYIGLGSTWKSDQDSAAKTQAPSGRAFRAYAARFWCVHAKLGHNDDRELNSLMYNLLDVNNPNWTSWRVWYDTNVLKVIPEVREKETRPPGPAFYATTAGLDDVALYLVKSGKHDLNETNEFGRTALFRSSLVGSLSVIDALIELKVDISAGDRFGWTPLHLAALRGQHKVLERLLEAGASVSKPTACMGSGETANGSLTAMHLAAPFGNLETMQLLLKHGADANARSATGLTPLHTACSMKLFQASKPLLARFSEAARAAKNRQVHQQKQTGGSHVEVVKLLIERGADASAVDNDKWTPLHFAAFDGLPELVALLLDNGADISSKDSKGRDALFLAAAGGHLESFELLVKRGADLSTTDNEGSNLIAVTAAVGSTAIINFLLEQDPGLRQGTYKGNSPLHMASLYGHLETVTMLVDQGADISAKGEMGIVPLHLAAASGHIETVRYLVEKGADVEALDNTKSQPLMSAAVEGHVEICRYLIEKGAKASAAVDDGMTAMHAVCLGRGWSSRRLEVAKLLFDNGADVSTRTDNECGCRPLHLAASSGHFALVEFLLEKGAKPDDFGCHGYSATHFAAITNQPKLMEMFLPHLSPMPTVDQHGRSELFHAVMRGNDRVLEILLKTGRYDLNATDWRGTTPLFVAVRTGNLRAASLLLKAGAASLQKNTDGFGFTLKSWAARLENSSQFMSLLDGNSEGIIEEGSTLIESGNPTKPIYQAQCDACSAGILKDTAFYGSENVAMDDFVLCVRCYKWGIKCPHHDHKLERMENLAERYKLSMKNIPSRDSS